MKFWDSSAIVPLLVEEALTEKILELYRQDQSVFAWWGTRVECASALARVERAEGLEPALSSEAFDRLELLADSWNEIESGAAVRETAQRFLRVHDLRAADALQLAAAFWASEVHPPTLEVVTLDDRLATAAEREGFGVIGRRRLAAS